MLQGVEENLLEGDLMREDAKDFQTLSINFTLNEKM